MVKRSEELSGSRIPKLGGFVRACSHHPSAIRTERCVVDLVLMVEGGNKLARGRIPELGAVIRACRQDPRTIWAKCCRASELALSLLQGMATLDFPLPRSVAAKASKQSPPLP